MLLFCRLAISLEPGIKAMAGHAEGFGNIHDRSPVFGDLFDGFDLEYFWITWAGLNTSNSGLILRLGSI